MTPQPPYEYSEGDRVASREGINGTVTYTDPDKGGVIRWDDGLEAGYTWQELGHITPAHADTDRRRKHPQATHKPPTR
jgi:hypothetical protein